MEPSKPAIPESLRRALDDGHVVPFVGAGVSMAVMREGAVEDERVPLFPSWPALLHAAADRLRREQIVSTANLLEAHLAHKSVDYYECAKLAQENLGDQRWRDLLVEMFDPQFGAAAPESLELARLVWKIESRLVITTNFDRVLQWTCPRSMDLRRIVIQESHALQRVVSARVGPDRPTVWHLHGHIEEPGRLVLAPDGYRRLYGDDKTQQSYIAAFHSLGMIVRTKTLLFIGFSLGDRIFMDALAQFHRDFQGSGGPHFVIAKESECDRFEVKLREQGLGNIVQVIGYADHGEPLLALLRHLANEDEVDAGAGAAGSAAHPASARRGLHLDGLAGTYLAPGAGKLSAPRATFASVSPTPDTSSVVRAEALGQRKVATTISEEVDDALIDDLGALLAAHARGFVRPISRITGMAEEVVLHQLDRAPGRRVQEVFSTVWPSDEALGDYTVAQIRRWQLTGAVARFVGRPYSEVETRLADEFGQTKVSTVFAERWQRADETEETEEREDAAGTTEDIESVTVSFVRRRGLAGLISEITGRPVDWVSQRLGEMHGKTYVMRAFRDHWPDDADLGAYTVARCLRLGLVARLARTLDRSPGYVQRRLSAASSDTNLRTLFSAHWSAA